MLFVLFIVELLTLITGLFSLSKNRPVILYPILGLTLLALINENIIIAHSQQWWGISRNLCYNIFSLVEISAWSFIFYIIFSKYPNLKRFVIISWAFIIIYSLIELFFLYSFNEFHIRSYMFFCIFSLACACIYIVLVTIKDYHQLSTDPTFWLCAAAISFNSVFFINLLTIADSRYWKLSHATEIFDVLQSSALIIYYIFICTAFITSCYSYRKLHGPAL